ncbi:hypothetical protein SK128_022320, partial [Halocaridina rubra]
MYMKGHCSQSKRQHTIQVTHRNSRQPLPSNLLTLLTFSSPHLPIIPTTKTKHHAHYLKAANILNKTNKITATAQ